MVFNYLKRSHAGQTQGPHWQGDKPPGPAQVVLLVLPPYLDELKSVETRARLDNIVFISQGQPLLSKDEHHFTLIIFAPTDDRGMVEAT